MGPLEDPGAVGSSEMMTTSSPPSAIVAASVNMYSCSCGMSLMEVAEVSVPQKT